MSSVCLCKPMASVILSNRLAVDGLLRDMAKSEIGIKDENINVEGLPLVLSAKKAFNYNKKIEGYTPEITMLKLWFADDLLHMEIKVHVEPSAGLHINYSVKATFSHEITTTTDKEGKPIQVITFKKKDYTEDKDVSAEWWVWFIGALSLGIGTIFVAITLGIVDSMSPSLESSAFHDALVKIDWNHMDIASIQYLNISGHIQIGAYITLLSE